MLYQDPETITYLTDEEQSAIYQKCEEESVQLVQSVVDHYPAELTGKDNDVLDIILNDDFFGEQCERMEIDTFEDPEVWFKNAMRSPELRVTAELAVKLQIQG